MVSQKVSVGIESIFSSQTCTNMSEFGASVVHLLRVLPNSLRVATSTTAETSSNKVGKQFWRYTKYGIVWTRVGGKRRFGFSIVGLLLILWQMSKKNLDMQQPVTWRGFVHIFLQASMPNEPKGFAGASRI